MPDHKWIYLAVLIPSVLLHEIAHGLTALQFGDTTARDAKRLTLNPLRHVDPVGTILLPGMMLLAGWGAFGWAKPVPVNPSRMRDPKTGWIVVSLAGPATNLALALLAAVGLRFAGVRSIGGGLLSGGEDLWVQVLIALGVVNVVLCVFNMLPIPPLDGSHLIDPFVPVSFRQNWQTVQRYGMGLVMILAFAFPQALWVVFDHALDAWILLLR